MKNNFFKIKHIIFTKIIAIFVLLLFFDVYSCRDEHEDAFLESNGKPTIEFAKSWYEMNKPAKPAFRSSDGRVEVPMKPDWSRASSKKNDKYEVIETDLMTYGMIAFVHPECMEKFNETQDMKYKRSYSRMVFRTNRENKETVGFIMTQIPNLEFLEKSNFKPFKKTGYLDRDKDFGGWIVFHNMDGSFSNGWVYEKGTITGSIKYFDVDEIGLSLRSYDSCFRIEWTLNSWSCPWWFSGNEYDLQYHCTLTGQTYIGTTLYCPPGDGGGGYDTTTNVGSGGGSATPASVAPNATKIFRNSNMSLENWKAIERMLKKIMDDCLGLGLYNGLDAALGNNTLTIQFGDANGFSFGDGTAGITLDMSFESNRLFHEMWHVYQAYQETSPTFEQAKSNL
jgi:hypothetical protein